MEQTATAGALGLLAVLSQGATAITEDTKAMRYKKTELGQTALQNRSFALTPRQRSAFIMFDGKRSMEEVINATAGLGVTIEDVNHLVSQWLLAESTQSLEPTPNPAAAPSAAAETGLFRANQALAAAGDDRLPSQSDQAHYSQAYPIAARLTAGLGLRGFRLNLAVEAAGDLGKLKALAPKIRDAVGAEKFKELENALYG